MKFLHKDEQVTNFDAKYIDELYDDLKSGKGVKDDYFVGKRTINVQRKSIQMGLINKKTWRSVCLEAQKLKNNAIRKRLKANGTKPQEHLNTESNKDNID